MTPIFAAVDPYILAFSAITVAVTIWMGFRSAKTSKTASDFFVAGRSVSVGWNASAISGEYLSAASFMGVAGMVMSSGYDALWYPVCYACGYLFLLLFIAGPLRRFGAYTIPDFAEGRFDSPVFRKIAVVFVLFIGFFYTMPQMKGAGTTLAYIFKDIEFFGMKGLPYWVGVVVVGAVITLNVALGGMKGITLVQAFQYWAKMFAISVPVFVLMAVYGHYGKQVGANGGNVQPQPPNIQPSTNAPAAALNVESSRLSVGRSPLPDAPISSGSWHLFWERGETKVAPLPISDDDSAIHSFDSGFGGPWPERMTLSDMVEIHARLTSPKGGTVIYYLQKGLDELAPLLLPKPSEELTLRDTINKIHRCMASEGFVIAQVNSNTWKIYSKVDENRQLAARVPEEIVGADRKLLPEKAPADSTWLNPFGPLTTKATKAANLSAEEARPYSLLYTYSLIIALVCGTAGLPHILVRFYTNPDGVAAKRTTMWVMILIGVFYVFPPVFGVMGRNLLPDLYNGIGAKGTDKIVLELPRLLNEKVPVLGSILSGITCAGAFAAFMSTFSGLLVSMTGALAHDVYGRMLNPKASPAQRMKMFKIGAILLGGVAMLLGSQVEKLEINFMVGQAFAIAAASYFPLLFVSVWWRGLTMKGAATGMLTGGMLAVLSISLTSFSDLGWLQWKELWAAHPLLRILCEQPAIWTVPLAITLMIVVSKLTSREVPSDIRMKMLVLHAPEKLGLKQEYIQEHQAGH